MTTLEQLKTELGAIQERIEASRLQHAAIQAQFSQRVAHLQERIAAEEAAATAAAEKAAAVQRKIEDAAVRHAAPAKSKK